MGDLSKDFSRSEFMCPDGCGFDTVDAELIKVLQSLRDHFGKRVTINSGCRCSKHNKAVGGAENSQHKLGRAADIVVDGFPPESVQHYLEGKHSGVYGIGRYNTFTHIDTRSGVPARWG